MVVWYAGGGMRGHDVRISFQGSVDDVCVCWRRELTFEIKLVDVFQRLVDKVETSKSLQEKKKELRSDTFSKNDSHLHCLD